MMRKKSPYYEGTNKNYSFRLLHNMDERIALIGKDRFIAELDELFGYTREPVERPTFPIFDPLGLGINSFEGFNNESDIEAPYAYLFAGRHDKTCEILRAGMKYMFTTGRGGLPGNNDSGGLSSFYVWNALGLFPVSGQNLILIGSPIVDGARLILANGNELLIKVHGQGDEHIYVKSVLFNGNPIENFNLPASTFMQGGKLDIFMQ
jgi:putative alpha-1,2-mannosidase